MGRHRINGFDETRHITLKLPETLLNKLNQATDNRSRFIRSAIEEKLAHTREGSNP